MRGEKKSKSTRRKAQEQKHKKKNKKKKRESWTFRAWTGRIDVTDRNMKK